MKYIYRLCLLLFVIGFFLQPRLATAAETTPHNIPWIKHQATIEQGRGVHDIDFGPDGQYLGVKYNHHVRIYDISSTDTIAETGLHGQRDGVGITYDGLVIGPRAEKFYVGAGYYTPGFLGSDHSAGWIEVYDLQTGEKLNEIAHHDWDLTSLSSGPNRRFFVSTDHVDDVVIWDNKKKFFLPILPISDGGHNLSDAKLYPPNSSLLFLDDYYEVHNYNISPSPNDYSWTDSLFNTSPLGFFSSIYEFQYTLESLSAKVSPNGKYILSSPANDEFYKRGLFLGSRIFQVKSKTVIDTFPPPVTFPKKSIEERRELQGSTLGWGPHSLWFFSEGHNGILYLRRINSGKKHLNFKTGNNSVVEIKFDPPGKTLLIYDGDIKLWSWDPPDTNPIEKTLEIQNELKD